MLVRARGFYALCAVALAVAIGSGMPLAVADYQDGVAYYNDGDYAAAFREFKALAEHDDMDAQQAIGLMYERGRGVEQDNGRAAYWYRLSAAQGHEIAAGNLGVLYRDGLGVPQDDVLAFKWLMQGAMGNDSYAKHNLGALYANGQGATPDAVEGWAWVFLAVEDGVDDARADLAAIGRMLSPEQMRRARERALTLRQRIDAGEEDSGYRSRTQAPGPVADEVTYTVFTDPSEGSYTVQVPAGWQISGGLARFNASDIRPWLRAVSPDEQTVVFMGDRQIPSMLVPNAPLAAMGFTEGMIYEAGYNQRFLLRSYHPGKHAARLYAQNNLAGNCGGAAVVDFRDRPELAAGLNAIFRDYGSPFAQQALHTGEVAIDCPGSGRAQYVFAGTLLSQIPSPQATFEMWTLHYLYGFDSTREDAATALAITRHLAGSFRITPQWARMNGDLQGTVSTIVAEAGNAIATTVSDGYWNAQRTREASRVRYGEAVLGVEDTTDPLTGDTIDVVSGANHYWVDPQGHVVGTQTDTLPGVDFRQLLRRQ